MIMKIFGVSLLLLPCLFFLFAHVSIAGLRCGTKLVHEGDSIPEVIYKCGEPDYVETWEIERSMRGYSHFPVFSARSRGYRWHNEPFLEKVLIRIEEWTYNFGSTQFLRFLRFENGILTDVSRGGYGY